MTQLVDSDFGSIPSRRAHVFSKFCARTIPGVAALTVSAFFGVWTLYLTPANNRRFFELSAPTAAPAPAIAAAPAAAPAITVASNPYGGLFDPRSISGSAQVSLAKNFPLDLAFHPVAQTPSTTIADQEDVSPAPAGIQLSANVPLPVPRPAELASLESRSPLPSSGRRTAPQNTRAVTPATVADNRSFFEKFFGASNTPKISGPVLAYAAPEDGVVSTPRALTSSPASRYDRWTAIYDIAAHTVYLPNGTRLEAHSGLRDRLDNPRYVNERMRGATPPNVYDLRPREALFHGVQALRLIPVGDGELYGRTGLLAHTYMLGPNGDSNGCVSFRNYNAFLQAYQSGEIRRLAVVTHMN